MRTMYTSIGVLINEKPVNILKYLAKQILCRKQLKKNYTAQSKSRRRSDVERNEQYSITNA